MKANKEWRQDVKTSGLDFPFIFCNFDTLGFCTNLWVLFGILGSIATSFCFENIKLNPCDQTKLATIHIQKVNFLNVL